MNFKKLADYDRAHVWHPYAAMRNPIPVYGVESARGAILKFWDGREVIDGMSSWWAVAHGYNNPHINEAVIKQLEKMSHVMFGGLTHEGAVVLARRLVDMTPQNLQKVFFCDSGSVSVEVAMKMALQYWRAKGFDSKTKFATIRGGYHGDTWHAMSVCDPVGGMHSLFSGGLPINYFAPRPRIPFGGEWEDSDIAPMRAIIREHSNEIAAVILEPVVQGAGGMRFYSPRYLEELKKICDEFSLLLIFDEIATGFGRTGKMFACQHTRGVEPDIMCLGKAITGGYVSFAATLASEKVSDAISDSEAGVFMHGPTFMANPLACAAANASIDLFQNGNIIDRVLRIGEILRSVLESARGFDGVADVRTLGAIGVVEMRENVDMQKTQEALISRGVWLRPFGRLIYTMPPYVATDEQVRRIAEAMVEVSSNPL